MSKSPLEFSPAPLPRKCSELHSDHPSTLEVQITGSSLDLQLCPILAQHPHLITCHECSCSSWGGHKESCLLNTTGTRTLGCRPPAAMVTSQCRIPESPSCRQYLGERREGRHRKIFEPLQEGGRPDRLPL